MTTRENVHLLFLDNDWRPLCSLDAGEGWRCIVDRLFSLDSQWLVIEQQRPGDPSPAPRWSDIRLSRAISRRLRPMEVRLADHVIQGSGNQFSFRSAGLL